MDFFHTQNQNQNQKHRSNHNKKRLNPDQVRLLERSFTFNNKLEPERKLQLANQLGVPPRQVAIWYQNKKARWKTQTLELDCNLLQQKLENALAEKRKLEKEAELLKVELEKAQETVFGLKQKPLRQVSCNSISLDEAAAGSSGFHEVLPLEDQLYACLIGADDGSRSWE